MANLEDQIIAAFWYGPGGSGEVGSAYCPIFGKFEDDRLGMGVKLKDVLTKETPETLKVPLFDVFYQDGVYAAAYRYGMRDSLGRQTTGSNILYFKKSLLTYPGATYFSLVPVLHDLGGMQKHAEVAKALKKRITEDTAEAGQWIGSYENLLKNALSALDSGYDLESTIAVEDCEHFQKIAHYILLLALDKGLSFTYSERALDAGIGVRISHRRKIPINQKSLQFDFDFTNDSVNINYPNINSRYYVSLVDFLKNEKIFRNKVAAVDFMRNLHRAGVSKRKLAGFLKSLADLPVWFSYAPEPDADLSALVEQLEDDEKKAISPLLEVANRADEVLGEEGTLYRSALYDLIRNNLDKQIDLDDLCNAAEEAEEMKKQRDLLLDENERLKEEINSLKGKQSPQAKPKRPYAIAQKMRQVEKERQNQQMREI